MALVLGAMVVVNANVDLERITKGGMLEDFSTQIYFSPLLWHLGWKEPESFDDKIESR